MCYIILIGLFTTKKGFILSSSISSSFNPVKLNEHSLEMVSMIGKSSRDSKEGRIEALATEALVKSSSFVPAQEVSEPVAASTRRGISSAKVLGGAAFADSYVSTSPSPFLEVAPPGAEFFWEELGKPMRVASFRSEPDLFLGSPSPTIKSVLSGSYSPGLSPFSGIPPVPLPQSIKYDVQRNYNALGSMKLVEDVPSFTGMIGPQEAYAYLGSLIDVPGDFGLDQYLEVNRLLLKRDSELRGVDSTTYCLVPDKFRLELVEAENGTLEQWSIEQILESEIGNEATISQTVKDRFGEIYLMFKIGHSAKSLGAKLSRYLDVFNQDIADSYASSPEGLYKIQLRAIVLLFQRLEQTRPVDQSRRTNLAVLNYLLAKHNFPGVIFKKQYTGARGDISAVDYMSSIHLEHQVIKGMKEWCRVAGRPYPFAE